VFLGKLVRLINCKENTSMLKLIILLFFILNFRFGEINSEFNKISQRRFYYEKRIFPSKKTSFFKTEYLIIKKDTFQWVDYSLYSLLEPKADYDDGGEYSEFKYIPFWFNREDKHIFINYTDIKGRKIRHLQYSLNKDTVTEHNMRLLEPQNFSNRLTVFLEETTLKINDKKFDCYLFKQISGDLNRNMHIEARYTYLYLEKNTLIPLLEKYYFSYNNKYIGEVKLVK
jgi:hypothetical protein